MMSCFPSHWGIESGIKRSEQQRVSELGCVVSMAEGLEVEGGQGKPGAVGKVTG